MPTNHTSCISLAPAAKAAKLKPKQGRHTYLQKAYEKTKVKILRHPEEDLPDFRPDRGTARDRPVCGYRQAWQRSPHTVRCPCCGSVAHRQH